MDVFNLLNTLTTTLGPSGMESDIATVVQEIWRPFVDRIEVDRMGNVIATKLGTGDYEGERRPRVLLSAHMDEIALMVRDVVEHNGYGFLHVTHVGGVDRRQLLGQRVTVHGRRNLTGVIACLPYTMLPDSKQGKARDFDDLVIDVGLSAEITRQHVRIGDFITFHQPLHKLLNNNVAGKALDNRASVAALTIALETLFKQTHPFDVIVTATIQEETRLMGGYNVGYSQQPDVAIAIDTAFAKQTGVSDGAFDLGSGPILDVGVAVHPAMLNKLKEAATRLEMKTSVLTHTRSSGTETDAIQLTRAGVPTALISIPIRNMHTMVETVNLKDIRRTGRLAGEFAMRCDQTFLSSLTTSLLRPQQ